LIARDLADADPTRLGERRQTSCDIHAVAEDVVFFDDYIP
jgi:hypothetical protein